jgi:hypothetical protein
MNHLHIVAMLRLARYGLLGPVDFGTAARRTFRPSGLRGPFDGPQGWFGRDTAI